MRKIIFLLIISSTINSCALNFEQKAYNFDNFRETPLWELAQAVRADNANDVKRIVKDKKLKIDLKDPTFNQTLLVLAIENHKKNAFVELLNAGANPNELVGNPQDSTPFINGIWNVDDCDLYYIENMLKHGANPNLEIQNPKPDYYFANSFPLLVAIGQNDNNANDCLNLIKLLVNNGADINCCYKEPGSDICRGVLAKALLSRSMETLKYFVIEKKINIPDTVEILGEIEKSTQQAYGLKEILNTEEYQFEDFESDGHKYDRSKERRIKNEILDYLQKNK
jgi:hypothetical protein